MANPLENALLDRSLDLPRSAGAIAKKVLARIRKTERAEFRVTRDTYKGREVIDFRLWYVPKAGGDWSPSFKGVAIDAGKLPELVAALVREA